MVFDFFQVVSEDFPIDNSKRTLKLVMGYVAVAFALTAQFYPKPWPETWALAVVCVIVYTTLSSTMQLLIWFGDLAVLPILDESFAPSHSKGNALTASIAN